MSRYGSRNKFNGGKLHTDSKFPIAFIVDGTGSMENWPRVILDNLSDLEGELEDYIPGFEMSITVVGDARSDRSPRQPLQVCDFGRGEKLHDFLDSFTSWDGRYSIGGGGGQGKETYELAFLLYGPLYCEMPNAELPFLFVIGDESYYDFIDDYEIRALVGKRLPNTSKSIDVIEETKEHFDDNVRIFRKYYGYNWHAQIGEDGIEKNWNNALGESNVKLIERAELINDAMIEPLKATVANYRGLGRQYLAGLEARKGSEIANYVKDLIGIKIGSLSDDADLLGHVESRFYEINR